MCIGHRGAVFGDVGAMFNAGAYQGRIQDRGSTSCLPPDKRIRYFARRIRFDRACVYLMSPSDKHPPPTPLDPGSPTPLYRQAIDVIHGWIHSGRLNRGDVLPTFPQLAAQLGVSEITVRRAIQELGREGLLVSRPGSGTFVANIRAGVASAGPNVHKLNALAEAETSVDSALLHIGMVVGRGSEGSPYLARSVTGIRERLSARATLRFFEQPGGDWRDAARFAESVPLGDLAGLLMNSPVNLELLVRCRRAEMPVVLLWNDVSDGMTACVESDLASGILSVVQHLVRDGRSRIALVTATERRSTSARRVAALHMSLQACGVDTPGAVVSCPNYSEAAGANAMNQLLSSPPSQRPDAVIFSSDQQAVGGINVCRKRRRSVPGDVAIVGMGNVIADDETPVPLTTLDLRADEVGRRAIHKLFDLQSPVGKLPMRHVVTPQLIIRDSA